MKIFIFEDNPERIKTFAKWFIDDYFVIVNNCKTATTLLQHEKFDFIFLDHDVGDESKNHSKNDPSFGYWQNTGSEVASVMYNTLNTETPIVIHSWNVDGANNMAGVLECNKHKAKVVIKPFGTFGKEILESMS